MTPIEKGCLYIVATPIGNLEDISRRAVTILENVDAIAAEDTRHTQNLLHHLGINTPLFAFHEHNESAKSASVLKRLQQGEAIALVSDAGTPLISDPGYGLVNAARAAGLKVIPVPGASSVLAALSCSGLPTDRFVFEGFLPAKHGARLKRLQALASENRTLVFFEAPHRILACLEDMQAALGSKRRATLARELTKSHETILTGLLQELLAQVTADSNQTRGEMVLIIEGNRENAELDAENQRLFNILLEELPLKQAAALSAKISGVSKNTYYQYGLENKNSG